LFCFCFHGMFNPYDMKWKYFFNQVIIHAFYFFRRLLTLGMVHTCSNWCLKCMVFCTIVKRKTWPISHHLVHSKLMARIVSFQFWCELIIHIYGSLIN
jgi:hypothetical protein